jgi:hypothetical protein
VIFPGTNIFKAELRFFDDPIQIDVLDDVLVHQFIANEPISILRAGLPNPLIWDEDLPLSSTEPGMLPIWAYIIDPDTPLEDAGITVKTVLGQLTPSIVMDDSDRPMLEISPMLNWFGNGSIEIEVTDGLTTDSALLNVTVMPVPDKPQPLVYPETVLAYEDVETNFTVAFSDPDSTDLTLGSPMQYLSIAPGPHPGSFNVSLTPAEGLVGNQIITLTATDGTGLNATLQLPLRVEPTNDPPVMLGEKVYEMIAGRSLTIDLKIADDGTGPYNVTAAWEFQTINANGSMITIDAPSKARRGIYYLTVNVTDSEGASSSISIRIDLDRKDRAILPITIVVIVVVTLLSLLIGYGVYSRMRERRLSENLSTVGGAGPATHELTIDDFQAGGGDYLAMPPSQLEKDLSPLGEGQAEPEEDEIIQSDEDLDGDIDDVIGEFYKD